MDHVDECSCVGYTVSNFDFLSELWENTQIQISFKLYSFTVIIVCVYSYKLIIRSTVCINLMWYILLEVLLFHSEVVFTLFFWYEVQFVIRCWLRQFWGIWHFNILYLFLFRKDWLILHQTKWSLTNKIFDEQMCTLGKHMSLTVSIKFINGLNGKIWVFTPLEHFWLCITLLTYILKRYNQYFSN